MFIGETILNRMRSMIETEAYRDPRFLDELDEWAFFISNSAFKSILREVGDDIYLWHAMCCGDMRNFNFQGYKICKVDGLKELEVYFGRRRKE